MRIIAITDIHGNENKVKWLVEKIKDEKFDVLLIAGDITHFKGRNSAEKSLKYLLELKKPVYAVMGNCDGRDVLDLLEELGTNLHDKRIEINGIGIVGFGGSNITPFSTIWEFHDDEIWESLNKNYRDGDILLMHVPPYKTKVDRTFTGLHVGSKALRKFIEERQPPLVICGHIHEARGIDEIRRTLIVNPGPLFRGHYAVIDINEGKKVSITLY
ncbi:YfcE family phosphodiesterase [Thermococcus barophilus]|uniref:Phosphoesterase n=1 Tax=Thermococcus barophilus TaxID=55802 RepID=A0A0S1XAM4_THEBA|nr:YfcE family phosphodiesterase [Thermococcus barophilus]ALM74808.1 hypothetical protein TBCH5v1_0855 [Thermococcus barophilus]